MRTRTLSLIVGVLVLFGLTVFLVEPAQAANVIDITATSTPITKIGCEQLGSLSFEFDPGSTLIAGDWWFIDLPLGVTICQPVNYMIVGQTNPTNNFYVDVRNGVTAALFSDTSLGIPSLPADPVGTPVGPIRVWDTSGSGSGIVATGLVAIQITGQIGSQRLLMQVIGDSPSARIAVGTDTLLSLRVVDGNPNPDNILLDSDSDDVYGEEGFADIPDAINPNPAIQLWANAGAMSGSILVFNPDSIASKYTFTGDYQLAHVVSADFGGFDPAIAYDPVTDHFLAVYSKTVSGTDQLWYLVLDGDGNAVSAPAQLYHDVLYNWNPVIAFDNVNGVFLVVWEHHPSSIGESEIYGMQLKVRPDGSLAASGSFTVNCDQEDATYPLVANQSSPAVAFDSINGNFVVTWEDDRNEGTNSGPGIFAQTVQGCDPIDVPLSCAPRCFKLTATELDNPVFDDAGSQTAPSIAFNPLQELFMTTGVHAPGGSSPQNIFVRPVDSSGNSIFNAGINFPSDNVVGETSFDPSITYNPDNQLFLVTWHQMDGTGIQGIEGAFASVIYNMQNEPATMTSTAFEITSSSDLAENTAVAYNPVDQKYLVTWWDDRNQLATGPQLFGQYIDTGGNLFGSRLTITDGVAMRSSALAPLPDISGFLSAYTRVDGGGLSIDWSTIPGLADTDGDGLTDGDETGVYYTDPNNPDSDGDGLWDGDEVNTYQTTPNDSDSDDDGYDDFLEVLRDSDPVDDTVNPMWENDTFIRRIASGQLESVVASYGYKQSNSLVFADPINFDEFEAEVTVTEIHSKSSNTRARLGGYFFRSGGRDIWAEIGLRQTDSGLRVYYDISSCGDVDCIDWQQIIFAQGPDNLNLNQSYTLRIGYDAASNQFTFGLDGQDNVFGTADGLPANDGPPTTPQRIIGTRVSGSTFGPDSGGYCRALFDNIRVYDSIEGWVLYDDFTGPRIDQDNWLPANEFGWQTWEFVRRVEDGYIQSAVANYIQNQSSNLGLVNPETIGGYSADVSVTAFDNNAAWTGARTIAVLYNDGTPGPGDHAGDIVVGVGVGSTDANLSGYYSVIRCLSGDCMLPGEYESIVFEPAFFPAEPDRLYTVGMNWNPATNEIEFNYFDHTTLGGAGILVGNLPAPVSPPLNPFRGIGTRISSIDAAGEYGYIKANFENVQITHVLNATTDFDNDGTPDVYDADDDGDGVDDDVEVLLGTDPLNTDTDADGVDDFNDPFPLDATEWADYDSDLIGDNSDNCPYIRNPIASGWTDINGVVQTDAQPDYDQDGQGNACDEDADNDGYLSPYTANGDDCNDLDETIYPKEVSPDVWECDGQPIEGLAPKIKPPPVEEDPPSDGDTIDDAIDNCPNVANQDQINSDGDSLGDACDNCDDFDNDNQVLPWWYKDADLDGYTSGDRVQQCDSPSPGLYKREDDPALQSTVVFDCNDDDQTFYPGATDLARDCDPETQSPAELQPYNIVIENITLNRGATTTDNKAYGTWDPQAGDTLKVTFKVTGQPDDVTTTINSRDEKLDGAIQFTDVVMTHYEGNFLNDDSESGNPTPQDDFDPPDLNVSNQITFTINDYGGVISFKAMATVITNASTTSPVAIPIEKVFAFPKDTDGDKIPDFYEALYPGDLLPEADLDGDGLTALEEYQGPKWGRLLKLDPANPDPNLPASHQALASQYNTVAYLPEILPQGAVTHVRTDPTRRTLFVKFANFNSVQFALGEAFHKLADPVEVFALGASVLDSAVLKDYRIDVASVTYNTGSYGNENGHIIDRSDRDWIFSTLGSSSFGDEVVYGGSCNIYRPAMEAFFGGDLPYQNGATFFGTASKQLKDAAYWNPASNTQLDPVGMVEDVNDNGALDVRENLVDLPDLPAGQLDGDHPVPCLEENGCNPDTNGDGWPDVPWEYDHELSPFDIDNNGRVELPVVAEPIPDANQFSIAQGVKHVATHELGHNVGVTQHTTDSTCVMYQYTNDLLRDGHFSPSAAEKIRIHNQ